MGIYEFKEQDAYDFARSKGIRTRNSGDEIQFQYCPFCHGGESRDTYTFAINRKTGAFNCKRSTCDAKGNMLTLSRVFDFSLGTIVDEYFRPRKQFVKFPTPEHQIVPQEPAVKYLESRGITEETAKRFEITSRKDDDNVLVFPFFDEEKKLVFIKYRKMNFDKNKDKNKEWCQKGGKPILFGMKQCNLENKTLIVTEGQIDSITVSQCGFENAVSVPTGATGFTWISYCWNWVQQFEEIIVFGDHEKGHITLLDEFSRRFGKKIRHVREEDYKDCKDANDILRKYGAEQVRSCIENAVQIPIKQVIDLSSVEDVDIFGIEKVKTGIKQLDRLLFGGLPFGGVHLLTGKAGAGKSTLGSQILIRARHQGYKCFAYSGELPNYMFKSWMNFQVAGRHSVFEYENQNTGYTGFNISQNNKKLISEWYKDFIYIYDNNVLDTSETEGLLTITENVIQQYGVRVVLLDNLMTAMIMDAAIGNDQYEKQTDFVNKLRVLALRYNVIILLVAHMRKNNFANGGNDEVAGSSNITNIATLVISYDRGKDIDENQRLVRLTKNRLFGKLDTDGIVVNYDERSKRIYGMGDDLDFNYGFNADETGIVETPKEMPNSDSEDWMPVDDFHGEFI